MMDTKRRTAKSLVTATSETSARTLAMLMRDRHVGAVVITEEDRPIGIVTDRDLVCRVMAPERDPLTVLAHDAMTPDPLTAQEGTPLTEAIEQMRARGIRRLPVVDEQGHLVNIHTLDDILVVLGDEIASLGRAVVAGIGKERQKTTTMGGRGRRR